jgi:hypothetical protein
LEEVQTSLDDLVRSFRSVLTAVDRPDPRSKRCWHPFLASCSKDLVQEVGILHLGDASDPALRI